MDLKSVAKLQAQTIFDQEHYVKLIEARGEAIKRIVRELRAESDLSTALDVGCGLGFFAEMLRDCGLRVKGFDARPEIVEEAQRRYPAIPFEVADIQDRTPFTIEHSLPIL